MNLEFYRGKRVFVTGHTGFKGSWLCRMLVGIGAVVTGYSLEPPTTPNLFTLAGLEGKMTSVIGDIRDFASLKAAFDAARPEIVLHLAAQPIVRDSYKDPRYTYETNVMGTVNLLECVRTAQTPPRYINLIKSNYLVSDIENPLVYNGSLLKRASIDLTSISGNISFKIHIKNILGENYVATVKIAIPLKDDVSGSIIYDGSFTKEITTKTNFSIEK